MGNYGFKFSLGDYNLAITEFSRILRPVVTTALWNPRVIESSQLLLEEFLSTLKPNIKRVSSGKSGITETLIEKFNQSKYFDDVIYIEGSHSINMSKERYIGVWKSVNDLQSQLGASKFSEFIDFVTDKVSTYETIEATYLTRSFSARTKKFK